MRLGACPITRPGNVQASLRREGGGCRRYSQWQAPRGQTGGAQELRSPGIRENPGAQEESQWPLEGLRQSSVWPSVPAREHPAVALLAAGDQPRVRRRSIA